MATVTHASARTYSVTLSDKEEATLARLVTDRAARKQSGSDLIAEVVDGLIVNAAIAHQQQDIAARVGAEDVLSPEEKAVVHDIYTRAIAAKKAATETEKSDSDVGSTDGGR